MSSSDASYDGSFYPAVLAANYLTLPEAVRTALKSKMVARQVKDNLLVPMLDLDTKSED